MSPGDFSVLVFAPEGEHPEEGWPVYMHIHGGGWVYGTVEFSSGILTRVCVGTFDSSIEFGCVLNEELQRSGMLLCRSVIGSRLGTRSLSLPRTAGRRCSGSVELEKVN